MSKDGEKKPFQRLPTAVLPRNYKIELTPDLEQFVFSGKLEISVEVKQSTDVVVLNCAEIQISSAKCGNEVAEVTFDEEEETVTFRFKTALTPGSATLFVEYVGSLNDKMRGFYRSKYCLPSDPDKELYAAVTQFEPTDARRALPCWDEPAHKATFDVTLVVPKDKVALSNMDVKETGEEGKLKRVTFNRTPIMSTYLLAFVVGDFDYVEARDSNGILVRVYTPVGKKKQGQFALDMAVKTLPFYTDYFNVPYPLSKMDLITIPDFAVGAMENWGLVTYQETFLLVDPENTDEISKQFAAIIISHELAHQWFGNLVTMEWWTHLWLNEGFATWIMYLCVDHCHPEYDIWKQFLSREYTTAMSKDAQANSHPIEVVVGAPSEVEEIFDAISYFKGAAVIRMLHRWIGDDAFRKGMNAYLTNFAYKNTSTEDLWNALGVASGKPVADVMTTWTKQMGYPVLTVDAKQENGKRHITISQKKFCSDGNITGFESMQWKVPITIATGRNKNAHTFLLENESTTITMDVGPDDWIKLNPDLFGFYRVNYTPDTFTPLLAALNLSCTPGLSDVALSPEDRLGLQNDAFALACSGVGSTVEVLQLFQSFSQETNYTVWENLAGNLGTIDRLISYTDFYDQFMSYAESLFIHSVFHLGWEAQDNESPQDVMLRSLSLSRYGQYGNKKTIEEAQQRFADHVSKKTLIPANLRGVVFSLCMANGDKDTFDQLIKAHDETDSSNEKSRIYQSLGKGKDDDLKRQCLEFAFSDKVHAQDSVDAIASVCHSPKGRQIAWDYFKGNFEKVVERFQGGFLLSSVVETTTKGFIGEDKAQEVEEFFKAHPLPAVDRVIKQCVEAIRTNTRWLERDREDIRKWLQEAQ